MTDDIQRGFLERLRQPAYTGSNRCYPCTILNIGIAAVGSILLGLIWLPAGAVAFVAALAVIYLRGYLVPGTPALTARYLPPRIQALFKSAPAQAETTVTTDQHDADIEGVAVQGSTGEDLLMAMGAIEECEEEDDICLTDSFREQWYREIDRKQESLDESAAVAALLDVDPDEVTVETLGEGIVVTIGDTPAISWESRAAMIADLAATAVFEREITGWSTLDPAPRCNLASKLRVLLDRCPACGGSVTEQLTEFESCCAATTAVGLQCQNCGVNVFEVEFEHETNNYWENSSAHSALSEAR